MSHVVKIETQIRDVNAIRQSCVHMRLEPPVHGTFELYNSTETGWAVSLRNWKFPVVCKVESGEVAYDNYSGRWGDQNRLNEFFQRYAAEKAAIEARRQGYSATEQQLEDGSIKVTIQVGGDE